MTNIKIAYMFGSLNRGGSETLMLDYFNCNNPTLDRIGIYRKGGDLLENFINTNVPLNQLAPVFALDIHYFLKLRYLLKSKKIDIIHTQQIIDAFYACIASIGTNIKVILTHHGFLSKRNKINLYLLKLILNRISLNIFVSEAQYKEAISYFPNKSKLKAEIVYNGINLDKFNISTDYSFRREYSIPNNVLLFGSVGNFNTGRDQKIICKFLDLLSKEGFVFVFVFIGSKSEKNPELMDDCIRFCKENELESKVHFCGSRFDVPQILDQLDAFIYSSLDDTFGIAVVESIISGTTTFINDTEVMTEISENGRYATLYKSKDEVDLFEKVKYFIQNISSSKMQNQKYLNEAKEKYSIMKFNESLKNLYLEILDI